MTSAFGEPWFYWATGIAIVLPVILIVLTEAQQVLSRKHSRVARQVNLLRNFLVPLTALLLLLVKVSGVPAGEPPVRILTTVFGFLVLVLMLSGLNATVFQGAPDDSWRKRLPTIFLDVARFALIGVGLAVILSFVWGVRVGGLFTALGVTSVVIGLMLQNSVGQIVSGLFMLFEQPFRINDWLDTGTAKGRVIEVNWRAVHIDVGGATRIMPNAMLASTAFTNLSRPAGEHKLALTTTFSPEDAPDQVCALLTRVAKALPQVRTHAVPRSVPVGCSEYRTSILLGSPADDGAAKSTFLRWVWYAARREGLHLDGIEDDFSSTERVRDALRTVVAKELRLSLSEQQSLVPYAKVVRYGTDETVQEIGVVPPAMMFVISGSVRMTTPGDDGALIPIGILGQGASLGLTTLTRQPNLGAADALEEVTMLEIDREYVERIVMGKPLLMQDLGRLIDERRSKVRDAMNRDRPAHAILGTEVVR